MGFWLEDVKITRGFFLPRIFMEMQIPCRNPLRKTKRRGRGVRRVGSNLVPLFLMEGHGSAIEENRF
jgi:hypothetical protein